MKCPKCGYHSFEHLEDCRKCGIDLSNHKKKFNLKGFFTPVQSDVSPVAEVDASVTDEHSGSVEEETVDFGFDFLDEESDKPVDAAEPPVKEPQDSAASDRSVKTGDNHAESFELDITFDEDDVNIDQPFGIDSETVPADADQTEGHKKKPDSEFSF